MVEADNNAFVAAVDRHAGKTPVASLLNTRGWSKVPLELKDRAFFSAGVAKIETVQAMQHKLGAALTGAAGDPQRAFMDKSKFVSEMREYLGATPGDSTRLTDLTSRRRLELIYDFNVTEAREHGNWKMGMEPDVLDAFPAQEFRRVAVRERERKDWPERFQAAGGRLFNGRMIALKTAKVWKKLSRFGKPWPPFDFGSGMGVRDLGRDEAEQLGLLEVDAPVTPIDEDFNQELEDSVTDLDPRHREELRNTFGDQIIVNGDKAEWQGDRIGKLFDDAVVRGSDSQAEMSLGQASWQAITLAKAKDYQAIAGKELILDSNHIRHTWNRHGPPLFDPVTGEQYAGEADPDQLPLTKLDYQVLPHVWRYPDEVRVRHTKLTLIKRVFGELHAVEVVRSTKAGTMTLKTLYKKP